MSKPVIYVDPNLALRIALIPTSIRGILFGSDCQSTSATPPDCTYGNHGAWCLRRIWCKGDPVGAVSFSGKPR